MRKTLVVLGFTAFATTLSPAQSRGQEASSQNLYFYGAKLPSETIQVTVYSREADKVEIRGNVTMTAEQWAALSTAVVQAGFAASEGEPTPVSTGRPR